ncbi:MAG TPA: hypothetical protein DCY03_00135 [Planctomycetaceae bacterium]|nr:hypothetical protein [Planctomycetaceae bacterium]
MNRNPDCLSEVSKSIVIWDHSSGTDVPCDVYSKANPVQISSIRVENWHVFSNCLAGIVSRS